MHAAEGILTARGGMTSHAAVVARGWGKPCVCGCEAVTVDERRGVMTVNATQAEFKAGSYVSINGTTGEVRARARLQSISAGARLRQRPAIH